MAVQLRQYMSILSKRIDSLFQFSLVHFCHFVHTFGYCSNISNSQSFLVSVLFVIFCDYQIKDTMMRSCCHNIQLESSRSPQVPPPRQSHSPGGVTIFALPAVPLFPFNAMVTKISK